MAALFYVFILALNAHSMSLVQTIAPRSRTEYAHHARVARTVGIDMIRMIELFAGIGAQASAMERLGIDHVRVAVAEWDEPTYRVYCAIHGETPNLGDITKVEHLPECDLITYSSPCQDISVAGHMAGLTKDTGTRSATLWDVGRLLDDMREREESYQRF